MVLAGLLAGIGSLVAAVVGLAWAACLAACALLGVLFLIFKVVGDDAKATRALGYLKKAALAGAAVLGVIVVGGLLYSLVGSFFFGFGRSSYVGGASYGARA